MLLQWPQLVALCHGTNLSSLRVWDGVPSCGRQQLRPREGYCLGSTGTCPWPGAGAEMPEAAASRSARAWLPETRVTCGTSMSWVVNSRNSNDHEWSLMWYANCCDTQLRYRSKSPLSPEVSNTAQVFVLCCLEPLLSAFCHPCAAQTVHSSSSPRTETCVNGCSFFPPFFSLDYPLRFYIIYIEIICSTF